MSATYNQVLIFSRDENAKEACNFWTLQDQGDDVPAALVTLASLVQACSRAHVYAVQYQTTHLISGSASGSPYPAVMDRAHLVGKIGATNVTTHYDLVAPKQDIFLADNVTVDLADPDVMALVAGLQANIGDAAGNPLTAILRGKRQWAGRNP